ncbi:MAG: peptidylprolyl isomerase [Deltaproteobacteria bacterium]|nr:peptidylprolyl isomerase [Deltaproteobacteria bacterium]
MSRSFALRLIAVLSAAGLLGSACKKEPPKAAEPVKAGVDLAKAEPTPAVETPAAASPTGGPTAPPAAEAKSEMDGACPLEGEDPAACPKAPDKVEDQIKVAHVLVGWDGSLPGKKLNRDKDGALKLAREICHEARRPGTDFVQLIWKYSGDGGPGVYELTPEQRGRMMPEFTAMGLKLGVGQVDVVATTYGYHVIKRVPWDFVAPDKPVEKLLSDPCPMEGEDPKACPMAESPTPAEVKVGITLVGYQGAMRSRATRSQDEAKALAIKLVHAARKVGADYWAVGDEVKADAAGEPMLDVKRDMPLPPPMKSLAFSLGVGQVDAVETDFGYMLMKRFPADYVKPEKPMEVVVTDKCPGPGEDPKACPSKQTDKPAEVEVTHILLAYQGAMRSSATRSKDEAKALAIKLCHEGRKKGADFNKIKDAAKSDDPGPGTYPVTPSAGMVAPFKQMAFALGVGQVDVVESDFGYHVMRRNK